MLATPFTDLVGCEWPVQLAPMAGGVGGSRLANAVRSSGGLGMVAFPDEVPDDRCGVNFLAPFAPDGAVIAEVARHAKVIEFFFGAPDPELVALGHRSGALVGWQVGSAAEAASAASAGCDYVVAQGMEAGGHVRGTEPLDDLLPQVLAAVSVPVVAAGGIATPTRVTGLIAAGASGVRVGTAFLVCPEANAHEDYVAALLAASGEDAVLTGWFDHGWPDAPHRVLRGALEAAQVSGWRATRPPCRGEPHAATDMAQYAGCGVGEVTRVRTAQEVLADLVSGLVS